VLVQEAATARLREFQVAGNAAIVDEEEQAFEQWLMERRMQARAHKAAEEAQASKPLTIKVRSIMRSCVSLPPMCGVPLTLKCGKAGMMHRMGVHGCDGDREWNARLIGVPCQICRGRRLGHLQDGCGWGTGRIKTGTWLRSGRQWDKICAPS